MVRRYLTRLRDSRPEVFIPLTSDVLKILLGPMREENPGFSALRAHYLFDSIFCAPGKGNEKGAVENGVGYVRRDAFVPLPSVDTFAGLNANLLAWYYKDRDKRVERWTAEHASLFAVTGILIIAC